MKTEGEKTTVQDVRNRGVGDVILPFLAYYLVYLVTAVILTQIVIYVRLKAGEPVCSFLTEQEPTIGAVLGGIAMLLGVLPLLPGFRRELVRYRAADSQADMRVGPEAERWGKYCQPSFLVRTLLTVVLALTSSIAVNILFAQLHLLEQSGTYEQVAESQYGVWFPVGFFLYGVVSPLAEEIVFRGVIYNRMKQYISIKFAVILSALLFGVYHGNIIQGIYGFVIGSLIAWVYERFGSFFFAVLFHTAANAAIYSITGNESLYQSVMRPVCGIACVMIALAVLVWMVHKKKRKNVAAETEAGSVHLQKKSDK